MTSLFGSTPPGDTFTVVTAKARNSIFDPFSEDSTSKSSLFVPESPPDSSVWRIPISRKSGKNDYIETLLPLSSIPARYREICHSISKDEYRLDNRIRKADISKTLLYSRLSPEDEQQILSTIYEGSQLSDLSRNKFNVLLALIGLAQENAEISLNSVKERRQNLPVPSMPDLPSSSSSSNPGPNNSTRNAPQESGQFSTPLLSKKSSNADLNETDPWGASPPTHRDLHHRFPISDQTTSSNRNGFPEIITSPGKSSTRALADKSKRYSDEQPHKSSSTSTEAWISKTRGISHEPIREQTNTGNPFGGDAARGSFSHEEQSRRISPSREIPQSEETVTVTLLPEKEGFFMFQHHNYHVCSSYRGSRVVRRYSDFVWLLDCLQKRFPFRQLPLLPPKRVGVNGNHLAADRSFVEKRRRGLARFVNSLLRHPTLKEEHLVIMFLTIPTELAIWRKQASITIQDEFSGRLLPHGLEETLPPSLNDMFEKARIGITKSAEIFINLCILMDRLVKRNDGLASDQLRISLSLQLLSDASTDTYATKSKDLSFLNKSLLASSSHLTNCQSLLVDEAKAWELGIIEDLKTQRDSLVSMRQLFERRDQYGKDNIPQLERKIQKNRSKLEQINNKPDGIIKPEEIDKLNKAIIKDEESIIAQHARGIFIKECIRDELAHFQKTQERVATWCQDWAQERVKYAELQADNWKRLAEELDRMPLGSRS